MSSSFIDNNERIIDVLDDTNEDNELPNNEQTEQEQNPGKKKKTFRKGKPPKAPNVSENPPRKRKNASPWWDHYIKTDDPDLAECLYCHTLIGCNPTNGTSCLANHTKRCKKLPANVDKKKKILNLESQTIVNKDGSTETIIVLKPWMFDQEVARNALAKMLIMDELPFMFVEREGFRLFCKSMHPQFSIPSRFTAARDCYIIFLLRKRRS